MAGWNAVCNKIVSEGGYGKRLLLHFFTDKAGAGDIYPSVVGFPMYRVASSTFF